MWPTGCLNTLCQTSNNLLGIKNTLLSHKNGICTFIRCGILTYDPWIWLKVTSMASTASNRRVPKIHKIEHFWWSIPHWVTRIGHFVARLMATSCSVNLFMKWGCWGHWGHWGHWGCWGSWWQGNHLAIKVQAAFDFLRPKRLLR